MSPIHFNCVICGYLIDSYATSSWLKEFRAVYSTSEGTFISGVGRYTDRNTGTWIVPWNPNVRWDDPDYDSQPHDEIPVMRQRADNDRHGFVLHESCWRLLQKFFEPGDVPIERLLSICKSLPFPVRGNGLYCGHTYGGLINFDSENNYPWEDGITGSFNTSETHARMDPYDVAEIPDIVRQSSQSPCSSNRGETVPAAGGHDRFAILPWEIVEAIATNLLVPDMLCLVRASKYFLPIMTSRAFWASRFEPGNDRDFLFEKRNSRETRDWAMLYQHTNRASSPRGLMNRRRIWGLIQKFEVLLRSHISENPGLSPSELTTCGGEWHEVAGDFQPSSNIRHSFYEGCILFHKQSTIIPQSLFGIAFSLTDESVTGMRLISKNHADISLGYINKREQHLLEVAGISGFILAIAPRGLQAVRVIDNNGHVSKWVGTPTGAPVTERLVAPGAITALSIGFDGYKVVSVAAAWPRPVVSDTSLRAQAVWYPSVPNQELYLNDESFMGENPLASGYRPLTWIHFGGPKGIYLRSITGIYVTRLVRLRCIEFEYGSENIPFEQRKIGRCKVTELSGATRFPIDGRGGEFINSVAVSVKRGNPEHDNMPFKNGQLESFKVTTNHGRSAHFKPSGSSVDESALVPLSIEPGTTLTGLSATQHPAYGLLGLGPISEVLSQ